MPGLLICLLLAVPACNKSEELPVRLVKEHQKAIVPYEKGQRVAFAGPGGDTVRTEVITAVQYQDYRGVENYRMEVYDWSLLLAGSRQPLIEMQCQGAAFGDTLVGMTLWSPRHGYGIGIGFNLFTAGAAPVFDCARADYTCLDSITVNGKLYRDVVSIMRNGTSPESKNELLAIYYTKEFGLIKFAYEDSLAYERIP